MIDTPIFDVFKNNLFDNKSTTPQNVPLIFMKSIEDLLRDQCPLVLCKHEKTASSVYWCDSLTEHYMDRYELFHATIENTYDNPSFIEMHTHRIQLMDLINGREITLQCRNGYNSTKPFVECNATEIDDALLIKRRNQFVQIYKNQ